MAKARLGIALGSGAARGWCHVGVLQALKEMGVKPDIVAGSSMGAIVGAAYADGKLDALEDWAMSFTPRKFVSLVGLDVTGGGFFGSTLIDRVFSDIGLQKNIEDFPKPFAAVASDLKTGREIWLEDGSVNDAVRASIAMPGAVSPHYVDGRWLTDGGLTNPVPVSTCRALGADVIIAVNPASRLDGPPRVPAYHEVHPREDRNASRIWSVVSSLLPEDSMPAFLTSAGASGDSKPIAPGYFDVVGTSLSIMAETICRARLAGEPPHLLLNAELEHMTFLEVYRAAPAIAEGRRIVEQERDRISALVATLED